MKQVFLGLLGTAAVVLSAGGAPFSRAMSTLLVASDAAREGTAYRCSMPAQHPAGTR